MTDKQRILELEKKVEQMQQTLNQFTCGWQMPINNVVGWPAVNQYAGIPIGSDINMVEAPFDPWVVMEGPTFGVSEVSINGEVYVKKG